MTSGLAQLILGLAQLTSSYRIKYHDCLKPNHVVTYNLNEVCKNEGVLETEKETLTLLQQRQFDKTSGYSCQITKSTFLLYCGAFSHTKLASPPIIEVSVPLTGRECESLVATEKFRSMEGGTHPVKLGTESIFHVTEKGLLHSSANAITCEGQTMKIGDNIVSNMLEVSQYKVILQKEEYLINSELVEVLADHLKLPCPFTAHGCSTNRKTYIWQEPEDNCKLEKVRHITVERKHDLIIDHGNKVIFNVTGQIPSPAGCTVSTLLTTEYPDLFLTKEGDFKQATNPVEIQNYVANRDNYIMFELEQSFNKYDLQQQTGVCQLRYQSTQVIQINKGHFGQVKGDVLYVFDCSEKTAKLETLRTCHDAAPIEHGFVDPATRMLLSSSAQVECNSHYPLVIRAIEGWVSINPKIIPTKAPLTQSFIATDVHHEDLSIGGIYTQDELKSWDALIQFSAFHNALSRTMSYGVCLEKGQCANNPSNSMPAYNLDQLITPVIAELNIFEKIDAKIKEYSGIIGVIVLVGWSIKLLVWLVTISITLTQEGIRGTIALLYSGICFIPYTAGKIRRKAKKHRRSPEHRVEDKFIWTGKEREYNAPTSAFDPTPIPMAEFQQ